MQNQHDLDSFYNVHDPWGYFAHPDDARRQTELLAILPLREWSRVLDIGCGNGFITRSLPGREVVGLDLSTEAVRWARQTVASTNSPERFHFKAGSLLDPGITSLGRFELLVLTGVLYDQYIGKASACVRWIIDQLLNEGGIVVTCHIKEWSRTRLPYSLIDTVVYPYREYTHQLEVARK